MGPKPDAACLGMTHADNRAHSGRLVAPSTDAGGSAGEEQDYAPAAGMFLVATVHFSGTMKLQVCDRQPLLDLHAVPVAPRQQHQDRGVTVCRGCTMVRRIYQSCPHVVCVFIFF